MVTQEVHCVDKCTHFPDDICSFPFQRSFSSLSRPVQDLWTCGDNRGSTNTCSLLESFPEQLITKKKNTFKTKLPSRKANFSMETIYFVTILCGHHLNNIKFLFFSPSLGCTCTTVTCFRVSEHTCGKNMRCSSVVNKELESHSIAAHKEHNHWDS